MDLIYWLMLLKTPQIGVRRFYQLLKQFESPQQVFEATHQHRQTSGLFTKQALSFLQKADFSCVQADLDWTKGDDCHLLTLIDEDYPQRLKTIADPPPLLYVRGDVACLSQPQLAIVGSRNPTPSGKNNAHQFAFDLSNAGLIITSGMASGIDAKAHIGALEANAQTIAVCGTGLDRIYPAKHKALAHQISTRGALISEFPIGTAPIAGNFPRRNRVISGLSLGTLVVEASIKSGTMITAKIAADQGREVFAIPDSIHNPLAAGCHHLIKQGAVLVGDTVDILNELGLNSERPVKHKKIPFIEKNINNNTAVLLKYLSYTALSVDELVEKTKLSAQIVTQTLLELELENKVAKAHGLGYLLTK